VTGSALSRQGSCEACLAWGAMPPRRGTCKPCAGFAARSRQAGECGSCGRHQPLKKGYCWLCWCQARLDRDQALGRPTRYDSLLPYARRVRHHQLFFAGMPSPRDLVRPGGARQPGTGSGLPGIPRKQPPPAAVRPAGPWTQPLLFTGTRRDYRRARTDRRKEPVPDNPWLAWALHLAHVTAAARGWSAIMLESVSRQLVMLLASHAEGETVRVSDFRNAVQEGDGITRTLEILAEMGIVEDDRPSAFDGWLAGQLAGLAPGIADEAGRWARAARDGTPRSPALHENSVRTYVAVARPALLAWSGRYGHLREVTRDDIRAHIAGLQGQHRHTTLTALRSLFAWAKGNGAVFRNPAVQLRAGHRERPAFLPLAAPDLSRAVGAATTPHARLFVALAAVHAARPGQVRAMQLSDVDLGNRRLVIAGQARPLDDLTRKLLEDWLAYRRQRWPNTANPHLLVSIATAPGTGPVSHAWVRSLRGQAATLDRLRIDRQLDEALAHGADPLHLAAVFGIDDKTAIRYAASARQLLTRPHETGPSSSP
jgi:integrase